MASQDQDIDGSRIENSDLRMGQADGDLIQGDGNTVSKIYVDLVGQQQPQWTERQQRILQRMQQDVNTRLEFTLNDDEVLIPLHLRDQGKQMSRGSLRLRRKLITPQTQVADLKQGILEVFCRADVQGKLLILGTPGAGKTTTLLTLAQELLAEALKTPGTMIPVIFELSTWAPHYRSLQDWLIAQLKDLYNLSPQEGAQWLENQLLLPLLDGLDELDMERQRRCIAALNTFAQAYPRVVVCCREQEYREAGATLDALPGQVCLEPLTDQQIEHYLHTLELEALWHDIQTSAAMRPMLEPDDEVNPGILRVPLLLSMAALTYEGQPFTNRAALYEAYIEQRLHYDTRTAERDWRGNLTRDWAYLTPAQEPDRRQTLRTLQWIARQLQKNNTIELLIERIQPSWLETPHARRYQLIFGLIFGLILGLIGGLRGILPGGLILGLIGRLPGGPIGWLILGLIFGLIVGLIVGLKQDLQLRSRPNQGIWNSLRSMLWTAAFGYPLGIILMFGISSLPLIVARGVSQGDSVETILNALWVAFPPFLVIGILGALFLGFTVGGGQACVQHVCLRFVLWQSGVAPWNLARFLNYCVERRLLYRVGGRYRFLHRELLDHFAEQPEA